MSIREIADRYAKVIEWSKEDACYVGRIPALHYGGVHGKDRAKVFAQLCQVAEEIVAIHQKDKRPLPPLKKARYSGRFVLRVPPGTHEALALKAQADGISLNAAASAALSAGLTR